MLQKNRVFAVVILLLLTLTYFIGFNLQQDDEGSESKVDSFITGVTPAKPTAARIHLDGQFNDWDNVTTAYSGKMAEQSAIKIANDEQFLFLYIKLEREAVLQEDTEVKLYVDADNNSETGNNVNSLGVDLIWNFGERKGTYHIGSEISVRDEDLGLLSAPTVSSDTFEIALERDSFIGTNRLFNESGFKFMLGGISDDHDLIPGANWSIHYSFAGTPLPAMEAVSIDEAPASDLRLVSYNVLRDNLFDPALFDSYDRILSALEPDIIAFVEIYDHNATQTAGIIEKMLPSDNGTQWFSSKRHPDMVVVSRYPINASYSIGSNSAFLMDLASEQLLLVVAHLPSGDKNSERVEEINDIMAFVTDAKTAGGVLDLDTDTPMIITGDMNLVGDHEQLKAFLATGYDWDGSGFTDLLPRHTNAPLYFTWYSAESSFWPGRLDFVFYSDSVISALKSFVLFTRDMPAGTLSKYGLRSEDTQTASDHLPVAVDLFMG